VRRRAFQALPPRAPLDPQPSHSIKLKIGGDAVRRLIPTVKLSATCGAPGLDAVFRIAPGQGLQISPNPARASARRSRPADLPIVISERTKAGMAAAQASCGPPIETRPKQLVYARRMIVAGERRPVDWCRSLDAAAAVDEGVRSCQGESPSHDRQKSAIHKSLNPGTLARGVRGA
jgi:hypothetical protein